MSQTSRLEGIRIRPGRQGDHDQVVAMAARVAAEGRWIGREAPMDHERADRLYLESLTDPAQHALVAVNSPTDGTSVDLPERPDLLVGHLHLGVGAYGVAELGMLVDVGFRGQGVGRALLDEAIAWCRAEPGVHKMALQVWPHNEPARNLYRSCGFVEEGYLHQHYRRRSGELWDVVVMGLQL